MADPLWLIRGDAPNLKQKNNSPPQVLVAHPFRKHEEDLDSAWACLVSVVNMMIDIASGRLLAPPSQV